MRNQYVKRYVTAIYKTNHVSPQTLHVKIGPRTLNTINAIKIPTSLHLFEYLMLNESSKNSSVSLNEQNRQAEVECGLVR